MLPRMWKFDCAFLLVSSSFASLRRNTTRSLLLILASCSLLCGIAQAADVSYFYDENGRLIGSSGPSGAVQYVYDAAGNTIATNRADASTTSVVDFSPKTGLFGTSVTIWGSGYSTTPSQNTVSFNG